MLIIALRTMGLTAGAGAGAGAGVGVGVGAGVGAGAAHPITKHATVTSANKPYMIFFIFTSDKV